MKRMAIFISGRGSNMENIVRQVKRGKIRAEAGLVFSDKPGAPGLKKAKAFGVETAGLERSAFESKELFEKAILEILKSRRIDFIVLAGYMKIVGPVLIRAYPGKILNIHPALLPSFKGAHAIRDAFDYGSRVTGVTVHFVDEQVDHGPIILQEAVTIGLRDRLPAVEKKIHAAEYRLYPRAIELLVSGKLKIKGRKVLIRS
ncbi:MAG TPA: phosphoribosylglycinamide formyltransferase [Candidatus Omnitrophota bacterium]|nr:phosphoribosylglycinamide formyltransferase [Candidatus Omnitrophota bacterium]